MTRILLAATTCAAILSALALAQDGPESVTRGTKRFDQSVVVSDLSAPWELIWGPDGMLWVTERTGKRITRVDPTTGERRVAVTVDEASAPGGQDGLLGMALHPEFLRGTGHDHLFLAYTYQDRRRGPDVRVVDPASPYRHLFGKVVRFRYDATTGTLADPLDLITGLPAGNDHNGMRLRIAPDGTLHLTIGDQGNNQLGNFCHPVLSQRLPTRDEIARQDYAAYEGKTLRIAQDGSIPADNPELAGVVSHVYTYGHRNPQGLDVGPDGTLYATDHGPKTDDEVNVLRKGGNYGWPHVAGLRDDKAYEYARWAEAAVPCSTLRFTDLEIHPSVPRAPESAFREPMVEPIATLFTVPSDFNFQDPACKGVFFICWPTVAVSSVAFYGGGTGGIPGWEEGVLLLGTLKRGSVYVLPLDASAQRAAGPISRYFQSENRYRAIALHPDGKTIYVATDNTGLVEARAGGATRELEHRGAILAFTYRGEDGALAIDEPLRTTLREPVEVQPGRVAGGPGDPPTFTAGQAAAGKVAYDGYCAVCHGSTLTNGTFGLPLAGEYFKAQWAGRPVAELYARSQATMPPAAPGSLPAEAYAAILAYVFDVNGIAAGDVDLPADQDRLSRMRIP